MGLSLEIRDLEDDGRGSNFDIARSISQLQTYVIYIYIYVYLIPNNGRTLLSSIDHSILFIYLV